MRALGIDVGKARVGLALSDPDLLLASPFATVNITVEKNNLSEAKLYFTEVFQKLTEMFAEYDINPLIVGWPLNLKGNHTLSTQIAEAFEQELCLQFPEKKIILQDERLTTSISLKQMRDTSVKKHKRKQIVDQMAAVQILQSWLDANKISDKL